MYFDMVFDQPFSTNGTAAAQAGPAPRNENSVHGQPAHAQLTPQAAAAGPNNGYVTFNTTGNQVVQAKVGVSYVSVANAIANRTTENPNWNFTATQTAAHNAWNSMLGRIQIAGGTSAQQQIFYTALYHSLLHPNVFSDTNGQYIGFRQQGAHRRLPAIPRSTRITPAGTSTAARRN